MINVDNKSFKENYRNSGSDNYKVCVDKGLKLMALKKFEAALLQFNLALAINPYNYKCYSYRAVANFNLRNYEAAIKDFDELEGIKVYRIYALFNKANIYYEVGKFDNALKLYNQVRKMGVREELLFLYIGKTLFHLNRNRAAIKMLEFAVSIYKHSVESYWYLARCYKQLNQKRDYALMLHLGIKAGNNDFFKSRHALAHIHEERGELDIAMELYESTRYEKKACYEKFMKKGYH